MFFCFFCSFSSFSVWASNPLPPSLCSAVLCCNLPILLFLFGFAVFVFRPWSMSRGGCSFFSPPLLSRFSSLCFPLPPGCGLVRSSFVHVSAFFACLWPFSYCCARKDVVILLVCLFLPVFLHIHRSVCVCV